MADTTTVLQTVVDAAKPYFPLVGVLLGYWLRGFETRNDTLRMSLSEISEDLEKLMMVTKGYWTRDSTSDPGQSVDIADEAEIIGRIHAMNSIFEDVSKNFQHRHCDLVRNSISDLDPFTSPCLRASDWVGSPG